MKQEEIQRHLDAVQPKVSLDSRAMEEVEDVLKHNGFWHLYSLLLGSRQAHYAMLSHIPLGNTAEVTRAAVIQGIIQGIELFAHTVLELGVPSQADTQEQKQ